MHGWKALRHYWHTCSIKEWEIWDRPTRFFHWTMTGLLAAALITGWVDPAWQLDRHLHLGGMISGLLLFRLLWGIFGSEYSRFSHYYHSPAQVWADLCALWRGEEKLSSQGLNPLNAWASLALLLLLCALVLSGVAVYGGDEHLGPLATLVSFQTGKQAQVIHARLSLGLLVLVAVHVWIVYRESRLTRVSLLRSMVTGCKPIEVDQPVYEYRDANLTWAVILGICLLFAVDHLSKVMGQLTLDGWRPLPYPAAYQEKCGHCHWAVHPSLLPEEAWQTLLSRLDTHFGEKIVLTGKEAVTITAFLLVHAAEDWNTKAANRFRTAATDPNRRIIDHPGWQKIHINIGSSVFDTPPVRSRLNCPVCHHDALSGLFDAQAIHLPKTMEPALPVL